MGAIVIGGTEPLVFTPRQAEMLTGVPFTTLSNWNRRGFLCPSVLPSHGRGRTRLYSFSDLVSIAVVKELRDAQISLQSLRKVIRQLQQMGYEKPLSDAYLVANGTDVELRDGAGALSLLKAPGQRIMVHYVDLATAVQEISERIETLQHN